MEGIKFISRIRGKEKTFKKTLKIRKTEKNKVGRKPTKKEHTLWKKP